MNTKILNKMLCICLLLCLFCLCVLQQHTYIHNWPLQPFSQDYCFLVSHTTYVVWVNFIHKWSTPNDRFFFEKHFMAILCSCQSFCQKSVERKSPKKYFSYLVLMSGLTTAKTVKFVEWFASLGSFISIIRVSF